MTVPGNGDGDPVDHALEDGDNHADMEGDEYDRLRRRVLWSLPSGVYLLGSRAGDRRNLMTTRWVSQVATHPKLVGVGVECEALTHQLILEGGVFAVSLVPRDDRNVIRRFVKPVGAVDISVDDSGSGTMREVPVRVAATGAPVLAGALAWLDCELRHSLDLGSHTWFVGEVVDAGFGEDSENLEVLRMEDTRMNYGG